MTTTERAAQRLKDILIRKFLDAGLGFRVLGHIDDSGRTVFDIKLDKAGPYDKAIESYGMRVLLDQKSAVLLSDYELDSPDGAVADFVIKATSRQKAQIGRKPLRE